MGIISEDIDNYNRHVASGGRGLIPHSFSQQTFLLTIHKLDKDRVAQPQPPICQGAWKKLCACTTRQPDINGISNRFLLIILFWKKDRHSLDTCLSTSQNGIICWSVYWYIYWCMYVNLQHIPQVVYIYLSILCIDRQKSLPLPFSYFREISRN